MGLVGCKRLLVELVRFRWEASLLCVLSLVGCVSANDVRPADASLEVAREVVTHPLSPEETEGLMGEVANSWFYGQGMGETALAIGAVVVFPPYAIYLAGNAALSLAGYDEVRISQALPESGEDIWNGIYDGVTSVPGQVSASVSGETFVTRHEARRRLERYLKRDQETELEDKKIKAWQPSD